MNTSESRGDASSPAMPDQASEVTTHSDARADFASKRDHAYRLGSIDAYAGRPERDMFDAESAWLMDALGESGPTTAANSAARVAMCDAYCDGWHDARDAMGGQ